ncbi:MAG: putative Fe-S protein YdhL (DUF1289 family) [Oleiphilaceae bacterium]|jgi:predicted Fe-S protein YdhL (DUF1289 family)
MSDKEVDQEKIKSPCVSICALDMDDVCAGCHRTGEEITRWWCMENAEKLATIEKAKDREKKAHI